MMCNPAGPDGPCQSDWDEWVIACRDMGINPNDPPEAPFYPTTTNRGAR